MPCCGALCAPWRERLRCTPSVWGARYLPCRERLRQLSTPAHAYAPLHLPPAARSNAASATRSGRFIRHRRRSLRSPPLESSRRSPGKLENVIHYRSVVPRRHAAVLTMDFRESQDSPLQLLFSIHYSPFSIHYSFPVKKSLGDGAICGGWAWRIYKKTREPVAPSLGL